MNNQKENNAGIGVCGKIAYESSVAHRATERAGNNINLKGTVHEVMRQDNLNCNVKNILEGKQASLTKSTTAVRDDIVTIKDGAVVGREQLKDTVASIDKTIKQVRSGKYSGTNLVGTKETVAAYNNKVDKLAEKGINVTQKMSSSGISSADTERIANTALGKATAQNVLASAKSAAPIGGFISGFSEMINAGKELERGEIDAVEFTGRVARDTAVGAGSAAVGAATATALGSALAAAGAAKAVTVVAPILAAGAVAKTTFDVGKTAVDMLGAGITGGSEAAWDVAIDSFDTFEKNFFSKMDSITDNFFGWLNSF